MDNALRRIPIAILYSGLALAIAGSSAQGKKCWDCRKPRLDIPISLAKGTVLTPEFLVKREGYEIFIRAEKKLPFEVMNCMLGLRLFASGADSCGSEPLLQVDWVVRDHDQVIAQGGVHWRDTGGRWAEDFIDRSIGGFGGESKKKYVLELRFTGDASALNVTNPRLIVIMQKPTDF
jgi:hypothetical protein